MAEKLVGRCLCELLTSAEARRIRRAAADLKPASGSLGAWTTELRRGDGGSAPLEINAEPLIGPDARLVGYRGCLHDLSVASLVREELRRKAHKQQALLRSTVDYVWELDRRGVLRSVGGRHRTVLGYAPEELIGRHLTDLTAPAEKAEMAGRLARRLSSREAFGSMEIEVLSKDGRPLTLEINGVPLLSAAGRFDGYQGSARDITKRRQAEAALKYRDRILDAITRAATMLMRERSVGSALPLALKTIGRALGSDRVIVLQRQTAPEGLKLLSAWQKPGVPIRLTQQHFTAVFPPDPEVGRWLAGLEEGRPALATASTARGGLAQVLEQTGSRSILLVPIMIKGSWWGQIGIDDCLHERAWSAAEMDTLRVFGDIVAALILREQHETERKRAEDELSLRVRFDPLTGLPNRDVFEEALEAALKGAGRNDRTFAVHYLDLDHFKDVNDTLGHPIGDLLLLAVADRLKSATRRTDMIARFGGDEFAVLQSDVVDPAEAGALASKLLRLVREPYEIQGHEIHIGASVGISAFEPETPDPEVLLSHAELALYRAKNEGRQTFRFFTGAMDEEARSRVSMADQLRRAIDADQFYLVYQPQVRMHDGRIVGLEALIRWRHPDRGVASPSEFIAAAERNGFIVEIGQWILKEACRQAKAWLDAGVPCPLVAVNMSAVQLRRPAEAERELVSVLEQSGLPRDVLQLEITETTLMEAAKAQADVLERLHEEGLRISLDDFGTGYSSLDYLRRYPVDQIKIAQVFVAGITENPGDAAIVKAAISLARELHLHVIAEGVETLEQARLLMAWGCPDAQGYYFSKPLSAADAEAALRAGALHPVALDPAPRLIGF